MSEVVVVRPMLALIYVKCPFCNTENWIDRTGTFLTTTRFRCEGCGSLFAEELLAIQTLVRAIDQESLTDDDVTATMAQELQQALTLAPSPTQKLWIERSCFYYAIASCPFCQTSCIVRYNAPAPHSAQWCPNKDCQAELVVTISATNHIGGQIEDWYKSEEQHE